MTVLLVLALLISVAGWSRASALRSGDRLRLRLAAADLEDACAEKARLLGILETAAGIARPTAPAFVDDDPAATRH